MSKLRLLYLALAVVGAIWPMWHFMTYLTSDGASLSGLFAQWTQGPAVTGMAIDLMIAGATLTIWIIAETAVRRNWSALWAIPAALFIGVSCGFPLYLFLRTRPV
ncbi:MAG: DUF2834 domain-containing protein [Maritimibacter harenae]|jgi:hypothetical protein|uniref:DUF2834 domain-containing protein n=1 Tax=Maritimibacter harenae TaxID=2606218 RepID=A0A845M764_9RHOB|nr:DUF2834 domain-containing protein [Maritimibacter harenae]MZR13577.1 DUF2834 domain-containing protein [Maritimibacter harenae]